MNPEKFQREAESMRHLYEASFTRKDYAVLVLDEDGEWHIELGGQRLEENVMDVPGVIAGRFYLVPVPQTITTETDWSATP